MRVTTEELVDRVLTAIDMEDGYATPAMVLRIINAAHPRFLFKLQSLGWVHNPIRENFTLQATASYTPVHRPLAVLGLYNRTPGSEWCKVQSESSGEPSRNDYNLDGRLRYSMVEETAAVEPTTILNLGIDPVPPSIVVNGAVPGLEYQLVYIAEPKKLYLVTDPDLDLELGDPRMNQIYVDFPNGWEEWLVLDAAITMGAREETAHPILQARKMEVEGDICQMVTNRLMADGPSLRNVDGVKRPMWWNSSRLSRRSSY